MPPQEQNDWFNIAYWIATNRPFFYKAVIFVLLFGNAIMWGIGGYFLWNYLITMSRYNRMMTTMFDQTVNFKGIHEARAPRPLNVSEETALLAGGSKADAIAKISNPNAIWRVIELKYRFVVNGTAGPEESAWALPGEERYLASFLIPANIDLKKIDPNRKETMPQAKLEIKKIIWQRIKSDPPKLPMFEFTVKNQGSVDQFSASVKNLTTKSYWSVGVYAVLYSKDSSAAQNEKIVSAKYSAVDQLHALEAKDFSFVWPRPSGGTKLILQGEVDPFDSNNILPFDQGSATQSF